MEENLIPVINRKHPVCNDGTGDGIQKIYRFGNNYGASVVRFKFNLPIFQNYRNGYGSYTDNEDEWELAIIKFNSEDNEDFKIIYDSGITDDVMGYLSNEEVEKVLKQIQAI